MSNDSDGGNAPLDYRRQPIPADKRPTEYTWRERRAEIVELMRSNGDPDVNQSQSQLADRYGVSQPQISKDFDKIRESMRHHHSDDIKVRAAMVFDNSVRELQAEGEHYKAAQIMKKWLDWLGDFGDLERAADKHAFDHDADFSVDVDDDGHVTQDLPDEAKANLDDLYDTVREATNDTRIDEDGNDLSREDAGLESSTEADQ